MSDESKTLDVAIMGKTYRVTCAPDEEKDCADERDS
jgi:cell division protein ZapA (FtsZ GTPase activity inhibitor)